MNNSVRTNSLTTEEVPCALIAAGIAIVTIGASESLNPLRYGSILISFGILVFMTGTTMLALDRRVQSVYVKYMWGAALVIVGSLTGVSVLGAILAPLFKP